LAGSPSGPRTQAGDPESLEASQDQDPSRKRRKTDSEREKDVRSLFEVLKADKSSISKLIASSPGSVDHFYGLMSNNDPRATLVDSTRLSALIVSLLYSLYTDILLCARSPGRSSSRASSGTVGRGIRHLQLRA